jgi:RNA polymerase sigma-70 factor (ECF subfamily)
MYERAGLAEPFVVLSDDLHREFEERLRETSTLAFRVAFSVLRHQQDAEDVAQEAYAKAYRGFRRLRDRERFRAWLVRTAWRTALDRLRANRRRDTREQLALAGASSHHHGAPDRSRDLWAAIDALPDKLRVVIVLASIQGHDLREVASLLQIPEGTVKSRLFLARQRLKEALS